MTDTNSTNGNNTPESPENEEAVERNPKVLTPEEFAALKLDKTKLVESYGKLVKDISAKRTSYREDREKYVAALKAKVGKQEANPVEQTKRDVLAGKRSGVVDSDAVRENIRNGIEEIYAETIDKDPWYAVALVEILESLLHDVRYTREFVLTSVTGLGNKPVTDDEKAAELSERREYLQRAIGSASFFHKTILGFIEMDMLPRDTKILDVPNLKGLPDDIKTPGSGGKIKIPTVTARHEIAIRYLNVEDVKPDYSIENVEWNVLDEKNFNNTVIYHLNPLLGMDKVTPNDVIAALKNQNEKWDSSKGGITIAEFATPNRLVQFRTKVVKVDAADNGDVADNDSVSEEEAEADNAEDTETK